MKIKLFSRNSKKCHHRFILVRYKNKLINIHIVFSYFILYNIYALNMFGK